MPHSEPISRTRINFDIEEVYAFAEQVLHGGTPLPVFEEVATGELGRRFLLRTNLSEPSDAGARLYYITQPMSYRRERDVTRMEQYWLYVPDGAVVERSNVKVRVPQEACAYFIELWRGNVMTSLPPCGILKSCIKPCGNCAVKMSSSAPRQLCAKPHALAVCVHSQ